MEPVYAPRRTKRINKKNKLHIVFDEDARREFLTGFHKRKLQRKKAAEEQLQQQLKEERKRIKLESKERYKKLVQSYKPIPELEEQFAQEYEVDNAKVSVLELDTDLLAETNFLIGRNRGTIKEEEAEIKEEPEEENESDEELPGMELTKKKTKEVKEEKPKEDKELKTKKEVKKELKKQATAKVKKSKIFQRKNRLERFKQKKKSMKMKKENMKIKAKSKKGKKQARFNNKKQNKSH